MNADKLMEKIFEYSSTINNCCAFVKECVYTGKCRFDKEGYEFAPQCTEREVFQTIKDALELQESMIQCKDCKHHGKDGYRNGCKYATCIMQEQDYCSMAERK